MIELLAGMSLEQVLQVTVDLAPGLSLLISVAHSRDGLSTKTDF